MSRAGPMNFILYQVTPEGEVAGGLGEPDYSYYFVMRDFRRVFERMGTVHLVEDREWEVDPLYDDLRACGEGALCVCFAPPHRCPVDLRCPTTSVFAWEFESIPNEVWGDDPRQDWRYVFRKHGRAIALSRTAARLVTEAMGDGFPVAAIPVPVWTRFGATGDGARDPVCRGADLEIEGTVLEGRELSDPDPALTGLPTRPWSGEPIHLRFVAGERSWALLNGFYDAEHWGTWSRTEEPSITLPRAISGHVRITVEATAYGPNVERPVTVRVGEESGTLELGSSVERHELEFRPEMPANTIRFSNLDLTPVPHVHDHRSMGIGLTSVRIERASGSGAPPPRDDRAPTSTHRVHLEGVVYTSVLNPLDGRKNWKDLVSGFVWALRDVPDAVLVLKMTHHDLFAYATELYAWISRLRPFRCRIVVIHAYLDDGTYDELLDASSYYANASACEGLCLPLVEFMSRGIPGIAAANTAMLDYLTPANSLRVRSWRVHNVWPGDPRHLYRTTRYRIDWEALVEQYRASYRIAKSEPERYRAMSRAARTTMEEYASDDVVLSRLESFIARPAEAP